MSISPLSPEQLRAALDEDAPGPAAEGWRLLREEVRALAVPLDPEFEARLRERITAPRGRPPRTRARGRLATWPARVAGRRELLASAAIVICALAVVLATGIFHRSGLVGQRTGQPLAAQGEVLASRPMPAIEEPEQSQALARSKDNAAAQGGAFGAAAGTAAPARVTEQAASIMLAAKPSEVQAVADNVSRLAGNEGGYVASSQVNVRAGSGAGGEATLTLSLPSAHLTQALAALGRLAPVRSQSNSLQDITSTYESAKRALADAAAERKGLLRALARASTQGEIESLRRRLQLAGGTISRDTRALQSLTRRASNSRVEVSVLASASAAGARSTLSRGLGDAGHVLAVVAVVLLIALAVLVPLGLLAALALLAGRVWRRRQRERALDRV